MKNLYTLLVAMCCGLFASAQTLPEPMSPPRLVNDFASMLKPNEQALLEDKLLDYHDTTSTQIYIVTVLDLQDCDIADYAVQLGRKWGIGQKGKNNGLLILIKPKIGNSRGDIFIATGYGLEGAIPDAYCKRIIENDIVPAFKDEQYYKGLDDATTTIIQMAAGEYKADEIPPDNPYIKITLWGMLLLLITIFIGFFIPRPLMTLREYNSPPKPSTPSQNSNNSDYRGSDRVFKGGGGGSFGGGGAGGSW